MNALIDNFAVHPGVFIQDELEARGWSQRDLEVQLGHPAQSLNRLLSGKASITLTTAKEFSVAFGISVDLFLNLQRSYDLATSKSPDSNLKRRALPQTPYPVREMINRGWLKDSEPALLESEIANFFEVTDVEQIPNMSIAQAAKKTDSSSTNSAQIAWLYRVRQLARITDSPVYSKERLLKELPRLRTHMQEAGCVQFVPAILERCGVRLVIVESLKGANICGATCWLSKDRPVIGLTTRYDRIDNFWFVLRHEIEHVLRGHGFEKPKFDGKRELNINGDFDEEEFVANQASLEFGIPSDALDKFINTNRSRVTRADIVEFAKEQRVHPGIVLGRVQNHLEGWNRFNDLNEKIRRTLILNAINDGWGVIPPT